MADSHKDIDAVAENEVADPKVCVVIQCQRCLLGASDFSVCDITVSRDLDMGSYMKWQFVVNSPRLRSAAAANIKASRGFLLSVSLDGVCTVMIGKVEKTPDSTEIVNLVAENIFHVASHIAVLAFPSTGVNAEAIVNNIMNSEIRMRHQVYAEIDKDPQSSRVFLAYDTRYSTTRNIGNLLKTSLKQAKKQKEEGLSTSDALDRNVMDKEVLIETPVIYETIFSEEEFKSKFSHIASDMTCTKDIFLIKLKGRKHDVDAAEDYIEKRKSEFTINEVSITDIKHFDPNKHSFTKLREIFYSAYKEITMKNCFWSLEDSNKKVYILAAEQRDADKLTYCFKKSLASIKIDKSIKSDEFVACHREAQKSGNLLESNVVGNTMHIVGKRDIVLKLKGTLGEAAEGTGNPEVLSSSFVHQSVSRHTGGPLVASTGQGQHNTNITEVPMDEDALMYLVKIGKLEMISKRFSVVVKPKQDGKGLEIGGAADHTRNATKAIEYMADTVTSVIINISAIDEEFFKSTDGTAILHTLERDCSVITEVMNLPGQYGSGDLAKLTNCQHFPSRWEFPDGHVVTVQLGDLENCWEDLMVRNIEMKDGPEGKKPKPLHTVTIVKGSLENIQADVIVNTTGFQLKLNSGVISAKLLARAGPELQNECSQKCPRGIHYGEIIHTDGYCLNCHHVLHGALYAYNSYDKCSLQKLQRFVIDCMRKMVALKRRSIAFPAIGTGNLRYPKDQVAVIMYRAVDEFLSSYAGSDPLDIMFVLWAGDTETVKAFDDAEHKRANGKLERVAPLAGFTKDLFVGGVTISAELGSLDTVKAQSIIYLWERQSMHSVPFSGHPLLKHLGLELAHFTIHRNDKEKRSEVLTTGGGQLPFIQKVVHVPCDDSPAVFIRAFKDGLLAADKGGMISAAVLFPANHPLLKHGDKVAHALIEAVNDVFPAHLSTLTDVCLMIEGNHNFSKVKAYMDSYLDKYGVPLPPLTAGSKVKVSTGKVAVKVIGLKGSVEEANRELTRQLDRRKLTETSRVPPLEQITPQITLTSAPPDLTMPRGAEGGGVPPTPLTEGSKVNVTTGKVAVKVIGLEEANRELTTQLDRKQLTETIRVFTDFRTTMNPSIVAAAKQKGILGDLVEELKIIDVCVDVDGDKTELVMKTILQLQKSMQIIEEFAANNLQLKRQTIISDCMDIDSATCSSIAWDVCQIVKKSLLVKIKKQKISVSYIDGKILIDRSGPESIPDNVRVLVTELKEFLSNEFEEIPIDGSGQDADRWCSEIEKFVGNECCIYVPEKNAVMAYGGQYDKIQLIRHKVNIKQGKVKQTARGRPQSALVASDDLLRSLPNPKSAVRQPPRKSEPRVATDKIWLPRPELPGQSDR